MANPRYRITLHRGPKRDGWTGELTGGITEHHYIERRGWFGWSIVSPGLESKEAAVDFLEAVRTPCDVKVVWEDTRPLPNNAGPWLLAFVMLVSGIVAFVAIYKQAHKEEEKNVPVHESP